jgi:PAS domain S-box-containing protein
MEQNTGMQVAPKSDNLIYRIKRNKLKLYQKILVLLALNIVVAFAVFTLIAYLKERNNSKKSAFKVISMVENIKKQQIEDDLTRLQNQLQLFASDSRTLAAFNSLWQGFSNIENDNFYTSQASSITEVESTLESYYTSQVIPQLKEKIGEDIDPEIFKSNDKKQNILQFLYIASSNKPFGMQYQVMGPGDGSLYSGMHVQYQPWLLSYAQQNKVSDIYFIEGKSGYVFYSMKKNPDFATNLINGKFKNSSLAKAFRMVMALSSRRAVVYADMDQPFPGIVPPSFYIAAPVFQGNQAIGAVIYAIEVGYLDRLLNTGKDESDVNYDISSIIIGHDLKYRSNDPDYLCNRDKFLKRIRWQSIRHENFEKIKKASTTALVLDVQGKTFSDARLGIAGKGSYRTSSRQKALCAFTPLIKGDLKWHILVQAKMSDILKPTRSLLAVLIITGIILLLLAVVISAYFSRKISGRINLLRESLIAIYYGNDISLVHTDKKDEIDNAIEITQDIVLRYKDATRFVSELSEGRLDAEFKLRSENDMLGHSFNKLKESLIKAKKEAEIRKEEDEIRNWTAQGIARFNDILRQDNNDLKKLAYNVIKNLIQYLSANQGGFFLLEDEHSNEPYLNLISAYAYDRQKFIQKTIKVGEGLLGNCVLEKQSVFLKEIPKDYIEITSGLGGATPRSLLIVPLKKEDQITGVIEIASFNEFKKHEIEFVEKVAESIASTLVTVKLHEQTTVLLEESRKHSEEMAQQEEELRQNLEELKATQEEMARVRKEEERKERERREAEQKMIDQLKEQQALLAQEKALLDSLLNNLPESIYFKDRESRFIRFSKSMLKLFKLSKPEELLGKTDFDMFDEEHARPAYEDEQEIIRTGQAIIDKVEKEVLPDGRINYVNTTKMPLLDKEGNIIGTFGISKDVTNFINMENELKEKNKVIQEKDEEIKVLKEELKRLRSKR